MAKIEVTYGKKVGDFLKDGYITQNTDGTYSCPCDFEIVKVDDNTWQCVGGGHRYHMDEGEMIKDKFGNMMLKKKDEHLKKENDDE